MVQRRPYNQPFGTELPQGPQGMPPVQRRVNRLTATQINDPHHYATFNGESIVPIALAADGGNLVLSAPDGVRNGLILRNSSATANVFVAFGNNASLQSVLSLAPGVMILFDVVVPQDDVFAVADAVAAFLTVAQAVLD